MSHHKRTRSGRKEAGLPKCSLLLLMGGVLFALPGGLFTPGLAENAQSEVSFPVEHHPLGVTLLTGDGTLANGFVWLKGENGETTPVELVDGYASFSMTPGENYELEALLVTGDGTMVEWSRPFSFQSEDGIMWLKPDGTPLAIYPTDATGARVRDLYCLLPDAPYGMRVETAANENVLTWDFTQFDSFSPVKYEVYHNDTLVEETTMREAVVSVIAGENIYRVAAVDSAGERRYGEILTLSLENESSEAVSGTAAGAEASFGNVGISTGISAAETVNVYVTNPDGSPAGMQAMTTHTEDTVETYYSKTSQSTFYYENPTLYGRTAADTHFLSFIQNAVATKWGKKFYCSVCGPNATSGHLPSYVSSVSWVHCFGLHDAAPVNHIHINRSHAELDPVDSSIAGGRSYISFPYLTQTVDEMYDKPRYWVETEVYNLILDLDVDSDNNGTIDYAAKNYESTEDRDEATGLGKVFLSTYHDRNGNGEIDCFENIERITTPDNFTLFNTPPSELYVRTSGEQLIPLQRTIPNPPLADSDNPGTVTFTYSASPPYGDSLLYEDVAPFYLQMMGQHRYMLKHNCETAQCNINAPCQPPGGALRLWGEYNGQKYFIPSGAGLNAARARATTFYVEGVKPSAGEEIRISYSATVSNGIDSAGNTTSQTVSPPDDVIKVTPFTITWEPAVYQGDNGSALYNQVAIAPNTPAPMKATVKPESIPV